MAITIDPVNKLDLEVLTSISKKTFYETFARHNTKEDMNLFLKTSFNNEVLRDELADKQNSFFFSRVNGELAGYLKLSDTTKPEHLQATNAIEISRIYVSEENLGHGVGKAMLEFSIQLARSKSKKVIWLGVWEHNQKAIRFYQNFGFVKFSEHIFFVGNDAQTDWLMRLDLF